MNCLARHRSPDQSNLNDLWRQPLDGGAAEPLWFNTPANELQGKVSPDGRWITYVTDESGTPEVWIASYPTGTIKQPVSRGGGHFRNGPRATCSSCRWTVG